MPVGDIASGLMSGLSEYIQGERKANRDSEDAQLDHQMQLIQALASRPDANPALLGSALHDLVDLHAAKGGKAPRKSGGEGMLGAHELPMSQFLAGMQDSTRAMGSPMEQVPGLDAMVPRTSLTGLPAAGAGSMGSAGAPGQPPPGIAAVPSAPIAEPPVSKDIQRDAFAMGQPSKPTLRTQEKPLERQPYLLSDDAMAEKSAKKPAAALHATMMAERDALVQMGMPPEQAMNVVAQKYGMRSAPASKMGTGQLYERNVNGQVDRVMAYPVLDAQGNTRFVDDNNQPLDPAFQPVQKQTGNAASGKQVMVDKEGNAWMIDKATNTSVAVGGPAKGKPMAPPAPYVYQVDGPNGPEPYAIDKFQLLNRINAASRQAGVVPIPPAVFQRLVGDDKNFVESALGVLPTIGRVNKLLEDNGMTQDNDMAAWGNARWKNALYRMGFSPDNIDDNLVQEDLQQQTGYIRALLLRGLMGGRPSQYIIDIFQQHIPAEYMTPARIYNTLSLIKQEMKDRYAAISDVNPSAHIPAFPGAGGTGGAGGDVDAATQKLLDFLKDK